MITLDQIYSSTDGGRDIYTSIRPALAQYFNPVDGKKMFKYREGDKTPSAMFRLSQTAGGITYWRLVDYGGDKLSPFDFYVNERGYGYMSFYEVIKRMASEFGVCEELSASVNKPVVEYREARPGEPDYIYEFQSSMPASYLPVLGPNVTADTCAQLNWHAVKYLGHRTKDGKMRIETPTDTYPILMRECKVPGKPSFYKVYKPLNPDKAYRFLYIGQKEARYICGLEELKEAVYNLQPAPDAETSSAPLNPSPINPSITSNHSPITSFITSNHSPITFHRLPRAFICSGERDALCLQSMGEHALWFNSETYCVSIQEMAEMRKYADVIYNIPDIDDTGRRKGAELALAHLDVHTVWLPNSLGDFRDNRGRKSKDLRDWMEIHRSRREFDDLVSLAQPARFWYTEQDRNGREKVFVDAMALYHFLQLNGFYTLRDTANNNARLVRVTGNVVVDVFPKDVRRFIRKWAEEKYLPLNVRNALVHHPHLQDASFENLDEINPCFDDSTESSQIYYFPGKAICVTAGDIREYVGTSIDSSHFVWQKNVLQHPFRKLSPMFRVTHTKDENGHYEWDIEIAGDAPSNVLKYLINTSRIHWRKEMEEHLALTAEEIREQKLNLISKLQGIGYLLHHHKTRLHVWAPLLLDNKIGENGQCNGRSGKSFLIKALSHLMDIMPMDGRNEKLMDNNHVFGTVKDSTRIISIDDCHERFDFNRFYSLISDDMTVNPKNQAQVTIPFEQSAKFCFSSNFVPCDFNASSEARRFYMVFSDYYHMQSEENDYLETRTIQSDFHKELHSPSYTDEEWNADINFFMQCLQFYLQLCQEDMNIKIVPPLYNIMQRVRRQQMGASFEEWADAYFAPEAGNLDRMVLRSEMFNDYQSSTNNWKTSARLFKKKLSAYCDFTSHIQCLNPQELQNAPGRIVKRISSDMGSKVEECFYVRSVKEQRKMEEQRAQQVIRFPESSPATDLPEGRQNPQPSRIPPAPTECPF